MSLASRAVNRLREMYRHVLIENRRRASESLAYRYSAPVSSPALFETLEERTMLSADAPNRT